MWKISANVWAFFERQTRFFRLGERVPLEEIMKGLRQLGFDGIELGVFDPAKDCSSGEVRKTNELLKRYNLEVPSLYVDIAVHWPLAAFTHPDAKVRRDVTQLLKTSLETAKSFGTKMVGISPDCDGFPHPFGVSFKDAWNWMREGISDCVDAAADAGLKLAFEYKPKETRNFSLIANADAVLRLIDQIGSSNLGDEIPWPQTTDRNGNTLDISKLGQPCDGTGENLYTSKLKESWCAAFNESRKEAIGFWFEAEKLPYILVWINCGGYGGYYHIALEPSTGRPDNLEVAVREWKNFATIQPRAKISWTEKLFLSHDVKHIEKVTPDKGIMQ